MERKEVKLMANIFLMAGGIFLAGSWLAPIAPENFSKVFGCFGALLVVLSGLIKCFIEYNNN